MGEYVLLPERHTTRAVGFTTKEGRTKHMPSIKFEYAIRRSGTRELVFRASTPDECATLMANLRNRHSLYEDVMRDR